MRRVGVVMDHVIFARARRSFPPGRGACESFLRILYTHVLLFVLPPLTFLSCLFCLQFFPGSFDGRALTASSTNQATSPSSPFSPSGGFLSPGPASKRDFQPHYTPISHPRQQGPHAHQAVIHDGQVGMGRGMLSFIRKVGLSSMKSHV